MWTNNRCKILFSIILMVCYSTLINAQERAIISGSVYDQLGLPLQGASIIEKGTTNGTVTNIDGAFRISVANESAKLIVSFIGFAAKEININGQTEFSIVLEASIAGLDEAVVIGYGSKQRKDLTGAIASISLQNIQQRGVSNLAEVIRGRVAGLISRVSTSPSGNTNLQIRGRNSIQASNSPLLVLDGHVFYGSLSDISPMDVEKIDVLKDASSAAIYGARSSSGVILITTKKGSGGKAKITVNSTIGFSSLNHRTRFRSASGYLNYRMNAFEATGANSDNLEYYRNPSQLQLVDLESWRSYTNNLPEASDTEIWFDRLQLSSTELANYKVAKITDWYDETTQIGLRKDNTISMSGSNDRTSHYLSINHTHNEGIIKGQEFEAFRVRLNVESQVKSFLTLGANAQFTRDNNAPLNGGDPGFLIADFNDASYMSPYGSKFNEDGSLKFLPHDDALGPNPFLYQNSIKDSRDVSLVGNIFTEVKLPWGLRYKVNWNNNFRWYHNYDFQFSIPEEQSRGGSRRDFSQHTWNIDNILTWEKQFGKDHKIDLTLLLNAESQKTFNQRASSNTFNPSEILGYNQLSFGLNPAILNSDAAYTADAAMARVNYIYYGKYLLTASIRRDGYSAFGENNRRAVFKAGALAWNISQEKFMNNANWLDNLKLRLSWGENGNRSIPLYRSIAGLGTVEYIVTEGGTPQPVTGFTASRLSNPNLKWERTESLNLGLDYSLFKGKFYGSLEYYISNTKDLLIDRRLPNVTGFNNILTNIGKIANHGFEAAINTQVLHIPNFSWNTNIIYSTNKNEIKELFGDMVDVLDESGNIIGQKPADDIANGRFIGQPLGVIYDYELGAVYSTDEGDEAALWGLRPGDFRVIDQNGDGVIDAENDRIFLGQTTPKHRFNWTNNFTLFKNFHLSISLDAQLGHKQAYNGRFGGGIAPGKSWRSTRFNSFIMPFWRADNQLTDWARIGSANPYGASYYEDRSFVRVQNITLGYTCPRKVTDALNISELKFSVDLNNLGLITNWSFFDPESYVGPFNLQNNPLANPVPFIGTARIAVTF